MAGKDEINNFLKLKPRFGRKQSRSQSSLRNVPLFLVFGFVFCAYNPYLCASGPIELSCEKPMFLTAWIKRHPPSESIDLLICIDSKKEYSPRPKVARLIIGRKRGDSTIECELAPTAYPEDVLKIIAGRNDREAFAKLGAANSSFYLVRIRKSEIYSLRIEFYEEILGVNLTYYVFRPATFFAKELAGKQ